MQFRNYKAIPIIGIPNVVVRQPVHARRELTIVIPVHVGNEESVLLTIYATTGQVMTDCILYETL